MPNGPEGKERLINPEEEGELGGEGGRIKFTPYQKAVIQKKAIIAVAGGKGREESLMAIQAMVNVLTYPSRSGVRRLK